MIGFGFIAERGHFPAYAQSGGFEIVAIADCSAARRERAQALCPAARIYDSAEALLENERELEFVDICTPPSDHVSITLASLRRGLHVLCEKPLALDPAGANAIVASAKAAQRVVMPCHNYKHAPVVKILRELVEQGTLGTIRSATISTYRSTHAYGVVEWDPHWRRRSEVAGGGVGIDHGVHSLYVLFMLMGGVPHAVVAVSSNSNTAFDTEDTISCALLFPSGHAHMFLSWTSGLRKVIYTVHGTRGAAVVDDDDLLISVDGQTQRSSVASAFNDASHASWFVSLFDQFRRTIEQRDWVNPELVDAYCANLVIDGIYRSAAASGSMVWLAEGAAEARFGLGPDRSLVSSDPRAP
jgi:predicted dehydrogenase